MHCINVRQQQVVNILSGHLRVIYCFEGSIKSVNFSLELALVGILLFESILEIFNLFVKSDNLIFLLVQQNSIIQKSSAFNIFTCIIYFSF